MLVGLVGWTVLACGMDNGHLGVFHDDGLYLTSARSLRDGLGFGLPSRPGSPPPKYPIGLPATIALALKLDPGPTTLDREIALGRGVVIVGGWVFFLAAHAWLRRVGTGPAVASGIILATAFHHIVLIGGAITIFADLPFAGIAFLLMLRWIGRDRETRAISQAFVDGLLAGYAILLRSNGITLAFAALVASTIHPRCRQAVPACLIGLAIAVIPATYYAGLRPRVVPSNSYILEMKSGWSSTESGLRILLTNAASTVFDFPAHIVASPATFFTPISSRMEAHRIASWIFRLSFTIVVGVGLISLARSSRLRDLPAWGHALGTVAIFLVWPWNSIMDRYLLSLIPIVLLAYVRGLDSIFRALGVGRRFRHKLIGISLTLVVLGNLAVVSRAAYLFHANGRHWAGASHRASLDEALGLIRERTETDAVVAAVWPEMVYLQTGRTVVPLVEDESILVGRTGDITRLNLWREQLIGRPFYALIRSGDEDMNTPKVDLPPLESLAAEPGLEVLEVARTGDGRYVIYRISERTPAEAIRSK
jgi:hypothetical protein